MRRRQNFHITNLALTAGLLACSPAPKDLGNSRGPSSLPAEGIEEAYNATPISMTGPTTEIHAKSQFIRLNDATGNQETLPIRFAEFWIRDSSNNVIQRGETDTNGDIRALVPRLNSQLKIEVRSRAFNENYKASVLDTPYDKKVYLLDFTLHLNASDARSPSSGQHYLTATPNPNGPLVSGAFNILHNVYLANQFLAQNTSPQPPIPKAQIYWQKGVTPAIYFGGTGGISFYVAQSGGGLYEGLYILGGIRGSLCVDTDHFDNSVILHEYAHFLEHKISRSDSPGGAHDGRRIIDPRLAWSEGYANYFQGIVLGRSNYRDTSSLGCTNPNLRQILFTLVRNSDNFETTDLPSLQDEGNFREMAIARYLFGITGTHPSTSLSVSGLSQPFQNIWNSFLDLSSSSLNGRSTHHFNRHFVSRQINPTDFKLNNTPFGQEAQNDTLNDWARPLIQSSTPCSPEPNRIDSNGFFSFQQNGPKPDRNIHNTDIRCNMQSAIAWSDMFNSNDFYLVEPHLLRSEILWIEYEAAGTPYDLDLYLYRSNFTFLNTTDIMRSSERFFPEEAPGLGRERISLFGLSPSSYFLNIKIDQPDCARATTRYRIRLGQNQFLCPNPNLTAN